MYIHVCSSVLKIWDASASVSFHKIMNKFEPHRDLLQKHVINELIVFKINCYLFTISQMTDIYTEWVIIILPDKTLIFCIIKRPEQLGIISYATHHMLNIDINTMLHVICYFLLGCFHS